MNAIARIVPLLLLLYAATPSSAQIGLPPLPTPGSPLPPLSTPDIRLPAPVPDAVSAAAEQPLLSSVRTRARTLLQRYPGQVERDPRGAPVVRAVILALSPDDEALQQAQARGFRFRAIRRCSRSASA